MPAKTPARKPPRPAAKSKRAPKTVARVASVDAFLGRIDAEKRSDCRKLDGWMRAATGGPGVMYGTQIVGYGASTIRYADGREAPWMKIGFSPRKQALTLYGVLTRAPQSLLGKLGKYSTGKGCLYIKQLSDVNEATLQQIITATAK